jgi:hypothetical protein
MKLRDVEIGKKYICSYGSARYFAVAVDKNKSQVRVMLGDIVNKSGDPIEGLGTLAPIWVSPDRLSEM